MAYPGIHDAAFMTPIPRYIILISDASGLLGLLWVYWLQYPWSSLTGDYNITAKELLPIVLAAAVGGKNGSIN